VKALRDLGILLLLLLGMLWLGAEPQCSSAPVDNGTLASATWLMPPFPDALLEQQPAVQLLQQVPGAPVWRASCDPHQAQAALLHSFESGRRTQQLRLQGRLQLLHRVKLYPFHEFG
jgi:hypothetical protein